MFDIIRSIKETRAKTLKIQIIQIIWNNGKINKVLTDNKKLSEHKDYHFRFYQGKVLIEENVFIGFNCVIAKPVTIGKNSVLGANTVIIKDVPPDSIIVLPESINLKKV